MLILRRMLIGNRARSGGFLKKTFFSAFMPGSAGTHRMPIFRRMLFWIQPRLAPIARNPHRTILKNASSTLVCIHVLWIYTSDLIKLER